MFHNTNELAESSVRTPLMLRRQSGKMWMWTMFFLLIFLHRPYNSAALTHCCVSGS